MFGWWQNSSRSVYFASQGKIGIYILPYKIIVTREIIFFMWPEQKYSLQCLSAVV